MFETVHREPLPLQHARREQNGYGAKIETEPADVAGAMLETGGDRDESVYLPITEISAADLNSRSGS